MKLTVLNITEEGRGGGPLKRIVDVASQLKDTDINSVALFPEDNSSGFEQELMEANIPYRKIKLHRLTKEKKSLLAYIFTFIPEVFALKKVIKKSQTDIVLCNGSWQIKGILAAKFAKAKSIWIQNDTQQGSMVRFLFKLVANIPNAYVYVSTRTKEYYEAINPKIKSKPSVVIQSPVNMEKFSPRSNRGLLPKAEFKILSVGYINPNKGFDTLARAIALVNKKTAVDIQFYIAGPAFDSQQDYYNMLLDIKQQNNIENLHFLGMRKDVDQLLNEVDLYVCSSDFEASPISIWEALASGLPIVSTDVGDVKEIIEENGCGTVVPCKNPKKLAAAVLHMLKDQDYLEKCRLNSRETAISNFSMDSTAANYREFYHQIAKSSS